MSYLEREWDDEGDEVPRWLIYLWTFTIVVMITAGIGLIHSVYTERTNGSPDTGIESPVVVVRSTMPTVRPSP